MKTATACFFLVLISQLFLVTEQLSKRERKTANYRSLRRLCRRRMLHSCPFLSSSKRNKDTVQRAVQMIQKIAYTQPQGGQRIRLRGNTTYYNAGMVEVFRLGTWGLVCDDSWDILDATVACRQLGFRLGSKKAVGGAVYGDGGRTDILMDEVTCQGHEDVLQNCDYTVNHDCTTEEAASLICRPNVGCPDGWIAGQNSCYQFYGGARTIRDAYSKCDEINSSLVVIETQAENDFLSNLLATSRKGDHVWYTAGRRVKKEWSWHKMIVDLVSQQSQNDSFPIQEKKMLFNRQRLGFTKWFPGWSPGNFTKQPSDYKKFNCLVMKNLYYHPNRSVVETDYFFWAAYPCSIRGGRIDFICERPTEEEVQDCYEGDGASYRGYVAHTSKGTTCMDWTDSPSVNPDTHPQQGLGSHNFCRNPDRDSRPWCWVDVSRRKFGYCYIRRCSDIPTTDPSETGQDDCPRKDFFCAKEKRCVSGSYKCDGEQDCSYGEDEVNCEYNLENFLKTSDAVISPNSSTDSYMNIPLETCATNCMKSNRFLCQSFSYKRRGRECMLSNMSLYFDDNHDNSTDFDLYELKAHKAFNCSGAFRCDTGRCVARETVCNHVDDCHDNSDEKDCALSTGLQVRIVNGGEHSGRVEIMYQNKWGIICDDGWDINDSNVICKMLGYSSAERSSVLSEFGSGNGNILLSNVNCTGRETSLADCDKPPWREHQCFSFEAAGVECRVNKGCDTSQFACDHEGCVPLSNVCDGVNHCSDGSDEKNCSVSVELHDGSGPNEGRVEISINGILGIICDDYWDVKDATVVCRMLGYGFGGVPHLKAKFGNGGNRTSIAMDDVACSGEETSLHLCQFRGWFQHNCEDDEAAGVTCVLPPTPQTTVAARDGVRIELQGSDVPGEGRVEIVKDGVRGTVCDDGWDDDDAAVICRILGFSGGTAVLQAQFGPGVGKIWLDEMDCQGTESTILDCEFSSWGDHDCSHSEDAGVVCKTDIPPVTVELVEGTEPNEGRVELIIKGKRGTICDDVWDDNDATVVCRMLGYRYGGIARKSSWFGKGSDSTEIFMDDVQCAGNEASILMCDHKKDHNCNHKEDAGVECLTKLIASTSLPQTVQCGRRPLALRRNTRETRIVAPPKLQKIVGGDLSVNGFYPWQVGVRKIYSYYSGGSTFNGHWCGATLLSEYWILSAAHCFTNLPKSRILVKVGDHSLKTRDQEEQTFEVEELIPYPYYDRASHDSDIALIKVKPVSRRGVKFSDYVQPACLPSSNATYTAGKRCVISGWGETGTGYPNILRAAILPIIARRHCNRLYKGALSPRMFCAGYIEGGVDTCQGDSGGPLVCEDNGVYTLFGITSWGNGCAKAYSPGVYTKVSAFLQWIKTTTHGDL